LSKSTDSFNHLCLNLGILLGEFKEEKEDDMENILQRSAHSGPEYQAYVVFKIAFVVAPLIAGLDKFFNNLTDWTKYLARLATHYEATSGVKRYGSSRGIGKRVREV
jgi:hypothetical protein